MNLVDAIRMASQAHQPHENAAVVAPRSKPVVNPTPYETPAEPAMTLRAPESVAPPAAEPEKPPVAEPVASTPVLHLAEPFEPAPEAPLQLPSHLVRIELFLTAEQSQQLLKQALGSQRAILNSREVAQLLRTTSANVERLASEGKLPAFRLDESWRFSKSVLDDWMAHQGREGEEGVRNVA
jgi:excisionase family DNA binding protein